MSITTTSGSSTWKDRASSFEFLDDFKVILSASPESEILEFPSRLTDAFSLLEYKERRDEADDEILSNMLEFANIIKMDDENIEKFKKLYGEGRLSFSQIIPEDQKKAVADLMLYVGQAVKMGYGASSGAGFGDNIPAVMTKYFGFDDAVTMEYRNKYSIDGWFNLIYNEIASKHPVAMSGSSSGGAHAFVLDGFDGENLFHVNWGWGGGSDGYFLLQILNPGDSSGAGASTSSDGYSMGQDVLIGLNYPDDVKVESNMALTINDIEVNGLTIEGNFINWTGSTGTYRCGIVRVNPDGSCTVVSSTQTATNLSPNTFMHYSFSMRGKLNTPGTYKLSPASRLSTHRYWHPQMNMYNEYILAEVDENRNVTLTYHHPDAALEIEDIKFVGNCKVNKEQEVKVTFRNTGTDEYYDEVHIFTSKSNDMGKSNCR